MIDAHAHQVPPDLRDRLAVDGERLGVRLRSDGRVEFASGEVSRPMVPGLFAPKAPAGCDLQIVSPCCSDTVSTSSGGRAGRGC
jgi:hypothetical protein